LGKSNSFEDFGTPQTYAALSLFVAWVIVGLCIIRGVKSSGKVSFLLMFIIVNIFAITGRLFHGYISVYSSSYIDYSKCNIIWSW
jgi:solute carrier family 6 amino acid transporter-like protein 5/7/9/14